MTIKQRLTSLLSLVIVFILVFSSGALAQGPGEQFESNPDDDGIGMQGTLIQPPPTDAPTIVLPTNGQVFEEIPVTVSGLCTPDLLVVVYKNGVTGGAANCDGGSYEMQIDLFPGANELVARQYDGLDQSSPESNKVQVTFDIDVPNVPGSPDDVAQRITLTSTVARRGADPGQEMTWPITLSGGRGPYAISIQWGDGEEDLFTRDQVGTFDVKHIYERPGVYRVIIKATDADGESAFLQLVGVGNGQISDTANTASASGGGTTTNTRVLWQPALIIFPLLLTSFWLGKRYQLRRVRYRIKNHIAPIDK